MLYLFDISSIEQTQVTFSRNCLYIKFIANFANFSIRVIYGAQLVAVVTFCLSMSVFCSGIFTRSRQY